jgi:hypothetical protein
LGFAAVVTAFSALLREASGRLALVERALVEAQRDQNGDAPTYQQVLEKIRKYRAPDVRKSTVREVSDAA